MAPSTRFLVGHLRHIFLIAESGDSTAPLRNERMDKFVYCGICLHSTEVLMWKESGFVLVEGSGYRKMPVLSVLRITALYDSFKLLHV